MPQSSQAAEWVENDLHYVHPLHSRREGVCEFVQVCGGSRARAFGMTGDWMDAEPFCTHIPARWARMQRELAASA